MSRLERFKDFRFVGTRDTMRVYDCDDPSQFEELAERVKRDELLALNLLQSFSPDSETEAANRGFKPVS